MKLEFRQSECPDGKLPLTQPDGFGHKIVRWRYRKSWHELVWNKALEQGETDREPLTRAVIRYTRYSTAEPDFDGLVYSAKVLIDGLIGWAIVDDRPSLLGGNPEYKWVKCKRADQRVVLEVEERPTDESTQA